MATSVVDAGAGPSRAPFLERAGIATDSPRFREEAIAAYLAGAEPRTILRAAPVSMWALFGMLASALGVAIVLSIVGHVEVIARGPGILRVPGGAQPIVAQTGGVVAEVRARPGASVGQGDVLLRIDSASTKAELLEADERLALVTSTLEQLQSNQKTLYERRLSLLTDRVALLQQRISSQKATLARVENKASSYGELEAKGYVGTVQRAEADEELSRAIRERIALEEEVRTALGAIASLESERASESYKWAQEAQEVRIRHDALGFAVAQMTVVAPQTGTLEAFLVRSGDTVQAGAVVARIVPEHAPLELVAFVSERDRAFVREGAEVDVEFEQLPAAEFGTFHATVGRVFRDLSSPAEVREVLAGKPDQDASPSYRVDLSLREDARFQRYASLIRPGMLVSIRYALRRRRILSLLLTPLERWLK
jgi:hemolysin D